jgi:uncharacterized protein DUF4139/uncharacterized protein DUF4140
MRRRIRQGGLMSSADSRAEGSSVAIASEIDAVTVYREGALVRRVARVAPAGPIADAAADRAGRRHLRLTGLPLSLDDSSVRVRVSGQNGAAPPIATDLRVVLEVPDDDAALAPADDAALEEARLARARLLAERDQVRRELGRVEALGFAPRPGGPKGEPPPPSPQEARLALLGFRAARERALRAELAALEPRIADAERQVAGLEDRERRASTARQAREWELRKSLLVTLVPVDAPVDSSGKPDSSDALRLEIDYLVPGARWLPSYVARIDVGRGRAELELRASVAQRTGEDWSGVALTLSTATAQRWSELPELSSVRIGRRQPPVPRAGWRPPPTGVEALYGDWDRAFPQRIGTEAAAPAEPELPADLLFDEATPVPPPAYGAPDSFGPMVGGAPAMPGFGGAMPPQLQSAPPPMPFQAPPPSATFAMPVAAASAKKGGGILSRALGAIGSAGAPAGMPPPQAMRSRMAPPPPAPAPAPRSMVADEMSRTLVGAAPMREEAAAAVLSDAGEPGALLAPDDLLAYGELRMPPPTSLRRGHLERAPRRDRYLALLIQQRVEIQFDVLVVVGSAIERARSVARLPPPPGHHIDWSTDYDHAYPAQARVDVPSDGTFHGLPVAAAGAPVALRHVVVPRESTDVFRVATLGNPLDAPLLPGPMDVYLGDEFLLTTDLELTAPRGEVEVGLGVAQAIKVARNTEFREETAGLMRGALLLRHGVRISIENHLPVAAEIEVRERIPVNRNDEDEEVEVSVGAVAPRWEAWDPFPDAPAHARLRGGYRWKLRVEPRGKSALSVDYDVKIAAKHELVGGNRREA